MLQSGFQQLKDFPRPLWLALYVEGTRFTKAKLLAAQEFAASKGLPIPRNVLIPRTKVLFRPKFNGLTINYNTSRLTLAPALSSIITVMLSQS